MTRSKQKRAENWLTLTEFSKDFAAAAFERFDAHQKHLKNTMQHERMQRSWRMYYSRGAKGNCDDTKINAGGERGEILNLAPANYRRLIQDRISLVQQTPPDFEPHAKNTDPVSRQQCGLALGLLDHYKSAAHLEELSVERFEMSSVLGASYYHIRWDPQRGKEVGVEDIAPAQSSDSSVDAQPVADTAPPQVNAALADPAAEQAPPTGEQAFIYEGDLVFSVRSPYEVAFDKQSPDQRKPRWWIVMEPMNRFDLLAEFGNDSPEIKRAIEEAPAWSDRLKEWDYEGEEDEFDDSIGTLWVYGERSSGVANGRKSLMLPDSKTILLDGKLDEDRAGVFPLWPSKVIFKAEGHTDNFGGMPVSQAFSAQISTILSNQGAYALARLLVARKANISNTQLATGLSAVEYDHADPSGVTIPVPSLMDQNSSPPELFTLLDVLEKLQDTVQGGSAVQRGDPNATKGDSGSKAALLLAQAQQIGARDIRALMRSDEDAATFMISSFCRHAKTDRVIAVTGKKNATTAKTLKGSDVSLVERVTVRQANPARDTFAGRIGMVELLKDLPPEDREEMQGVLLTGRFESFTDDDEAHVATIDRENEQLLNPTAPMPEVLKTDLHMPHFQKCIKLLESEEGRKPGPVRDRIEAHAAAHIAKLTPMHPEFAGFEVLMATGQQPLTAPAMTNEVDVGADVSKSKRKKPAGEGKDGMPKTAQQPKNPATGQRSEGAAPTAMLNGPS